MPEVYSDNFDPQAVWDVAVDDEFGKRPPVEFSMEEQVVIEGCVFERWVAAQQNEFTRQEFRGDKDPSGMMPHRKLKMVVTDCDGTIWDPKDYSVPSSFWKAYKALRKAGVPICLNTGRPPRNVMTIMSPHKDFSMFPGIFCEGKILLGEDFEDLLWERALYHPFAFRVLSDFESIIASFGKPVLSDTGLADVPGCALGAENTPPPNDMVVKPPPKPGSSDEVTTGDDSAGHQGSETRLADGEGWTSRSRVHFLSRPVESGKPSDWWLGLRTRRGVYSPYRVPFDLRERLLKWEPNPPIEVNHWEALNDVFEGILEFMFISQDPALEKLIVERSVTYNTFKHFKRQDSPIYIYTQGGKAVALKQALRCFGLSKDEVAVLGDDLNDIDVFELCPHSYCMADGPDAAKSAASKVVPSHREGGWLQAIAECFPDLITAD